MTDTTDAMRDALVADLFGAFQARGIEIDHGAIVATVDRALALSGYAALAQAVATGDAAITALQANQAPGVPPSAVTDALDAWTPARTTVADDPINGVLLP